MKRANRIRWLGAIALGVIVLLTLIAAPHTNLRSGSTYSRAPDGYGAWYAYMQQQGTPVQRWQKPFSNLEAVKSYITLLRVNSQPGWSELDRQERDWVEKGNTLIILGLQGKVTAAAFTTTQQHSEGSIKIDTRRRYVWGNEQKWLLGDRFGAVVWQEQVGEGQAIFCITPDLAANAYQDYPNNYKYLAQLAGQSNQPVWVDEYIHGYKDADIRDAGERDWSSYLAQKPLFLALLPAAILLMVLIWAQNQRFGQAIALETPVVDNSTAYIEALAGVLQKAESSEFVADVVGKAEQMQLQKALGLGQEPLDRQTLVKAWVEQTRRSPVELEQLLQLKAQKRRISDKDLLIWLEKWQTIRRCAKPD